MAEESAAATTEQTAAPDASKTATETAAAAGDAVETKTETAPAAAATPTDWRAAITDPDAKKLADSSTDLNHFAMRTLDMRQKLSVAIVPPGKDAKPEEVAEYRKKIGVPDTVEGYVFENPEGYTPTETDKAIRGTMASAFHANNIPVETAKALTKTYNDIVAAQVQEVKAANEKFAADSVAALRQEWGTDYDTNKALAQRAAQTIMGPDFEAARQIQDATGRYVLDNPVFVKMLAKIGRETNESGLGGVVTESERNSIQDQIGDLRKQQTEASARGDSRKANELYQREQGLIAKLQGSKPIVGAQGRAA